MMSNENRRGDPTFGPLQLKSIWDQHDFRNFDLMVIIQASGCEHIAERVLQGEAISADDRSVLEIANDLAQQSGYLPLFDLSGVKVLVAEGGDEELAKFFVSDQWATRNPQGTRKL